MAFDTFLNFLFPPLSNVNDSANNTAICYKNSEGVEKNLDEAIRLYKIASNGGNLDATNKLALLLK